MPLTTPAVRRRLGRSVSKLGAALVCGIAVPAGVLAQSPPITRDIERERPDLAEPASLLDVPPARECRLGTEPDGRTQLKYRGVRFQGNTVFSDAELLSHLLLRGEAARRALSVEDVECIRLALTQLYIAKGYVNSGVLADVPKALGEPVLFRVVEGVLADVRVQSVRTPGGEPGRLWPDYVRNRLTGDPATPLNQADLEGRFRALLQDPNVERLNGLLVPGERRGEAVLDVDVVETEPLSFVIGANNFDPRSTGEIVGFIAVTSRNQIGFGDAIGLELEASQGRQSATLDFEAPISAEGLLLVGAVEAVQTRIVEEPLDVLDIEGSFLRTTLGLDWAAYNVGTERLTFGLRFEYARSKSFLLGEPFSFSPGAQDGIARASVVRVFAEYVQRSEDQAFSVRGTGSFGLPVLAATRNPGETPDGAFASFLGEVFYVRSATLPFLEQDMELSLRAISQVTADRLLPFEQVALTGADVVRGFREDAVADDNMALIDVAAKSVLFDVDLPAEIDGDGRTMPVFGEIFLTAGTAWPAGDFDRRQSAVGGGFILSVSPSDGLSLSVGFAGPLYASDLVEQVDAAEPRLYLSSEFRF